MGNCDAIAERQRLKSVEIAKFGLNMVALPPRFSDVQNHWARLFIEGLAQRGIISGFPDGTFQPDSPMTRAQYAAVLQKAFSRPKKRPNVPFTDVPTNHWAVAAIRQAYETGFISGYPGNLFRPDASIARVEALVSLTSGLDITLDPTSDIKTKLPELYDDANQIPNYAIDRIAAATELELVVNYPNLKLLKPSGVATRA
ncbi:MAG TPA: S-layer homology domain-containing protein, partial [Cyanophyceae cyanobacterium]